MSISYFFRGNLPPRVTSLTVTPAPATTGSPITFTCTASDLDGTVVSVEYFLDGISRGISTAVASSFTLSFTPSTTGLGRVVTAQSTDNLGVKSVLFTGTPLDVNGATTAPAAMAQPTGVANSANSVTLTYAAPANGGSAITDYQYSYSSNGGSTYTVFPHTATTALSQTITGLVGGTAYLFRVQAINAIGTGLASTDYALSTPSASPTISSATFTAA
jgi:hypothetical protein